MASPHKKLPAMMRNYISFPSPDSEAPSIDFCSSPPVFLVDNPEDVTLGRALVDWTDAVFHDNSRQPVSVTREIITSLQGKGDKSHQRYTQPARNSANTVLNQTVCATLYYVLRSIELTYRME